jgi:hypothetical protein
VTVRSKVHAYCGRSLRKRAPSERNSEDACPASHHVLLLHFMLPSLQNLIIRDAYI